MYLPEAFAVSDPDEQAAVLRNAGLGCLITHGPQGLFASHLPFAYDAESRTLRGHLALANPHRRMAGDAEALAVFTGGDAYISPSFYPSKAEHGRVVPTWNYEAAHVYGRLSWHEDPAWLRANLAALTDRFEHEREHPWTVDDAPEAYIQAMLRAVVGVELQVSRIEVKRKLSQNRNPADRQGVIAGLAQVPDSSGLAVAAAMAALRGNA